MSKNAQSLTLGIGDLSVDGQDVGYLGGDVTVTTETESVEFRHGTHQSLVKRVVTTLNRSITASLAQIDIDTLKLALGIGEKTTVNGNDRLNFGANWELAVLNNVKFVHTRDDGKKVTVFFPKAQVNPDSSELNFSNGEFITQNITINAVEDTNRPDCPMGFIQVGDNDDTNSEGGGARREHVDNEVVTGEAEESWFNYNLSHRGILLDPAPIVTSEDGEALYQMGRDYIVDSVEGIISTNGLTGTTLTGGAAIKVSYDYFA